MLRVLNHHVRIAAQGVLANSSKVGENLKARVKSKVCRAVIKQQYASAAMVWLTELASTLWRVFHKAAI